jgi:putative RNA 2'-phosphotransferase
MALYTTEENMAWNRSNVRISKLLSLMLRHRPDEFGIEVDRYGSADLGSVLLAIQDRDPDVELAHIESVVNDSEKQRFLIEDGRIRARYGHSFPVELGVDPTPPPEYLYKGVEPSQLERILLEGIQPEDRQYIHLSFEASVAGQLGGKNGPNAVVRVDALRAHEAGVEFFDCGPTILVKEMDKEYLALESEAQIPETEHRVTPGVAPGGNVSDKPVSYGRKRKFGNKR